MPKKGSRSIVVDEVPYRWRVNRTGVNMKVSVEPVTDGGDSSILSVDSSVGLPNGCLCDSCFLNQFVTPAVVEAYIRLALKRGWTPTAKGKPFVFVADASMSVGKV